MSDRIAAQAARSRPLVDEITGLELPEPSPAETLIALEDLAEDYGRAIRDCMRDIDLAVPSALASFGADATRGLAGISVQLREALQEPGSGPVTDTLDALSRFVAGVTPAPASRPWDRLLGRAATATRRAAQHQALCARLDGLSSQLLAREQQMLEQIRHIDQLYEETLGHYDTLALYIAAGTERLREDQQAAPSGGVTALEDRLAILGLCRRQIMQALPGLRQLQENDKGLLVQLSDILLTVVPAWERALKPLSKRREVPQHAEARAALLGELERARDLAVAGETGRLRALSDLETLEAMTGHSGTGTGAEGARRPPPRR